MQKVIQILRELSTGKVIKVGNSRHITLGDNNKVVIIETKGNCMYVNTVAELAGLVSISEQVRYSIVGCYAILVNREEKGFSHGPVLELEELLEIKPETHTATIIKFLHDGMKELLHWNPSIERWVSVQTLDQG